MTLVLVARWSWVAVIAATLIIGAHMFRTTRAFDDSTELASAVAEMRTFQEEMFQLLISSALLGEEGDAPLHAIADDAEAHAAELIARVEGEAGPQEAGSASEVTRALNAVVRNLHAIAELDIGADAAPGAPPAEDNPLASLLGEQLPSTADGLDGLALNIVLGAVGYAALSASVTADIDRALEALAEENQAAVRELKQVGQFGIAFLLCAGVASSGGFAWAGRRARRLQLDVEQAQELDRLKSEFVGLASHELRTPLTGIYGFSELALSDQTLSNETRNWIARINEESAHLTEIVGEMLDLSRIESGRMELAAEPVALNDVVATVVERFVEGAPNHHIVLAGDFETVVTGDRAKLTEVVSNLVDNAIKYSPEGGEVRISGAQLDSSFRMRVSDSGLGIPPEEVPLVFNRFHRVRRSDTEGIRSTGLGLYLVRELVMLMGGVVDLESKLGQGTTVTVTLPTVAPGGVIGLPAVPAA